MNVELEKENLALKVNSNALNQKTGILLLTCELLMEYRQLNGQLLAHAEKLKEALNDCAAKTINPVGTGVPNPPSTATD